MTSLESNFVRGMMDKLGYSQFSGYGGNRGYGIPVGQAIETVSHDPFMSPNAKKSLLDVIRTSNDGRPRGIISWSDVARTAMGYGLGRVAANTLGHGLDYAIGGLSPKSRNRLSQIGGLVGALGGARLIV